MEKGTLATPGITEATVEGASVMPEQGVEQTEGLVGEGQEEFFGYTFPDGEKKAWKSRKDLENDFRDSYHRDKDYYGKTRALSDLRKSMEAEKAEMAKQREEIERTRKEYDDFNWMVKNRPDVHQYLQKQSSTPASADVAYERARKQAEELNSKLGERVKQLENKLLNQDLERQRDSVYEEMQAQFPNFDRQRVSDLLDEIGSGDLSKIVRVLYHADSGMRGVQAASRREATTSQEKAAAQLTPSGGSGRAERKVPKDLAEAAKLAEREWAGMKDEY